MFKYYQHHPFLSVGDEIKILCPSSKYGKYYNISLNGNEVFFDIHILEAICITDKLSDGMHSVWTKCMIVNPEDWRFYIGKTFKVKQICNTMVADDYKQENISFCYPELELIRTTILDYSTETSDKNALRVEEAKAQQILNDYYEKRSESRRKAEKREAEERARQERIKKYPWTKWF